MPRGPEAGRETYDRVCRRSLEDPEGFWGEAAELVDWTRPPDRVLDDSRVPLTRALVRLGRLDGAEATIREAIVWTEKTDSAMEQGETHMLLGQVLLEASRPEEAWGALEAAIGDFRRKGISVLEGRASQMLTRAGAPA